MYVSLIEARSRCGVAGGEICPWSPTVAVWLTGSPRSKHLWRNHGVALRGTRREGERGHAGHAIQSLYLFWNGRHSRRPRGINSSRLVSFGRHLLLQTPIPDRRRLLELRLGGVTEQGYTVLYGKLLFIYFIILLQNKLLKSDYSVVGIPWYWLRESARNSIRDRHTPAIIGTGGLSHYPLAFGYAWRSRTVSACWICWWDTTEYSRFFYVNQGWGGSGNGWVSASTWFVGEVYP